MPALKARGPSPQASDAAGEPGLRLASHADVGSDSEVARLQSFIEAEFREADGPRPWPRAVSVPITIAVASGLWWAIIAGAKALLRI